MFLGVGNYGFKVFFDAPVRIADLVQARVEKVLEEEEEEVPSSCVRKKKASPLSPSLLLLQHQFSPKFFENLSLSQNTPRKGNCCCMIKELTFFSIVLLLLLVRNKLHETHTLEFISSKTKTRALLLHHFFLCNFKSKTWTKSSPLLKTQPTDLTDYPQNANVGRSTSNLILALQTILPPSVRPSLPL
jgi:hypothetical protein